ncbi:MAG: PKD domain-containing protein, partial [Thermoproteota archaeon]|nr:PKD domain-containing protein [Thermoproteota archaeon]
GSYDVGLTVTDSAGQTASDSIEITVKEEALAEEPVATEEEEEEQEAAAAPSPPPTIIEPPAQGEEQEEQPIITEQPLTVDITSSDTEGRGRVIAPATFEFEADVAGGTEPYTINWNFDDDGTSSEESDDDETISHTFEEAGKYNVGAIVTDSSGQRAADTIRITVEEAQSPPSVIRELAEQGEDAISEDNLPPQQQEQQPDAAPSTGATEEIPAEQLIAQGNNQGGEQGETTTTTTRPSTVTQSIQQNTSQSMQVGIPNGGSSSEERSDDNDDDENVDHIFDEAGSHNGDRTVTDIEDQRASDSIEGIAEAPSEEPLEEEPSTEEIPAEQLTAGEVKPDLFDSDNNSGSDDLIDVDDVFDVDKFIDDLFDELGLNN